MTLLTPKYLTELDFVSYPLSMMCNRCGENRAYFSALCNECEFRVLTGMTTFTPADVAAWEQEIDFQIDAMIEAMHA